MLDFYYFAPVYPSHIQDIEDNDPRSIKLLFATSDLRFRSIKSWAVLTVELCERGSTSNPPPRGLYLHALASAEEPRAVRAGQRQSRRGSLMRLVIAWRTSCRDGIAVN